ncbi:hypothetical protein H671_1g0335 [Cricetulus griseus]|nr:hypothetical protein H671_1g0335 [Cricetulus griseus]
MQVPSCNGECRDGSLHLTMPTQLAAGDPEEEVEIQMMIAFLLQHYECYQVRQQLDFFMFHDLLNQNYLMKFSKFLSCLHGNS